MAGARGGYWVNAFALPSLYRPAVLFTQDLLEALGPREVSAVYAHELAHLEHHSRKRLLLGQLGLALITGLLLFLLLHFGIDSPVASNLGALWPLCCLFLLFRALSRSRKHEQDSDLRALELCEDPQALMDSLRKIHILTQMPRRWDQKSEWRLSHPSLAQRIRAIREAAGMETVTDSNAAGEDLAFRAADDEGVVAVLSPGRLVWLKGVPAETPLQSQNLWETAAEARAMSYGDLAELRLEVGTSNNRYLLAVDRSGTTLKMLLDPNDVAAAKQAVERIDSQILSTAGPGIPDVESTGSLIWGRVEGVLAMLFALWPPFSGPFALASLLLAIKPARVTLAAAGITGPATAFLAWRGLPSMLLSRQTALILLALQALVGLYFLLRILLRHRRGYSDPPWALWMTLGVLSGAALLSALGPVARLASPSPILQLHLWARHSPGLAVLFLGLAAAALTSRKAWARALAASLVVLALATTAMGSLAFRARFGDDVFTQLEPRLQVSTWQLERTRSVPVESGDMVTDLRLSPDGIRLAAQAYSAQAYDYDYDDEGALSHFLLEGDDGELRRVEASVLELVDEERLAVLRFQGKLMTLIIAPVSARDLETEALVKVQMPRLAEPRLKADASEATWEVVGRTMERDVLKRFSGVLNGTPYREESWELEENENEYLSTVLVSSSGQVLTLGNSWDDDLSPMAFVSAFSGMWGLTEVSTLTASGKELLASTSLQVRCVESLAGDDLFLCLTSDREHTQIWEMDPGQETHALLGSLKGDFYESLLLGDGRLLLKGMTGPIVIADLEEGCAGRIDGSLEPGSLYGEDDEEEAESSPEEDWILNMVEESLSGSLRPQYFAARGGYLATAVTDRGQSRLDVYRLPEGCPSG